MSQKIQEGPLREAAILTRAVENVLRKFVRLLLGRMSLTRLQEMIRIIFVQEAEKKLKEERPERNVQLTKLALLTGLDTRTLNKLLYDINEKELTHDSEKFLKGILPETAVFECWISSKKYQNNADSKPLELDLKGDFPSFETLVREAIPLRGVTTKSIIDRLENANAVFVDHKNKKVKLVNENYQYFVSSNNEVGFETAMITMARLAGTLIHNVEPMSPTEEPFYQRNAWSQRIDKKNIFQFRKLLRDFLEQTEKQAVEVMLPFEEETPENKLRAGVGLFYFEEDPAA